MGLVVGRGWWIRIRKMIRYNIYSIKTCFSVHYPVKSVPVSIDLYQWSYFGRVGIKVNFNKRVTYKYNILKSL